MPRAKISIMEHRKTGLLAATSDDLPGFIVHAHTEDEMTAKLATAFKHFMEAKGDPVHDVQVEQKTPAGYWPPTYVASGELDKKAA